MRIDLNVPYGNKDEAKRLGARWDGRTWYLVDIEDLTPFQRWLKKTQDSSHEVRHMPITKKQAAKQSRTREKLLMPVITHSSVKVPHCGCYHVLPWIDCEHNADYALDNEQQAHIKSIMVH